MEAEKKEKKMEKKSKDMPKQKEQSKKSLPKKEKQETGHDHPMCGYDSYKREC